MSKEYTKEEIEQFKKEIDAMSQMAMAKLWRFAPSGHPYFRNDIPELSKRFNKRFAKLGGFTPEISKAIGWKK